MLECLRCFLDGVPTEPGSCLRPTTVTGPGCVLTGVGVCSGQHSRLCLYFKGVGKSYMMKGDILGDMSSWILEGKFALEPVGGPSFADMNCVPIIMLPCSWKN